MDSHSEISSAPLLDYKRLFELSTDLVCVANAAGYFVDVNPQFCKTLGFTYQELTSRPWLDFVHPDDIASTLAEAERLTTSVEPTLRFVNRYITKDNEYRHFQWAAVLDHQTHLLYCVVKDITQQVEMQDKLRLSEEYLRQAQRTAKIGHWMVGLDDMKPLWSEETYRIHEVPLSESPSLEKAINYYDEASKPIITEAFTKCISEGIPFDIQLGLVTAKGNWRWVRSIGQPEYQNGKLTRVFGVFQDITVQYEFQTRLMEAKERAEEGSKAKSTFLSNMSHEIRTPLNAVLGAINLLLDTQPTDYQQDLLNITKFSGENLLSLVNDILDLSKIEAGKAKLEASTFNPRERFDSIFQAHRIRADKKSLNFEINIAEEIPDLLWGDYNRIEQVINNLLSNAIKFTLRGGVKLEVGVEKVEKESYHRLHFRVIDSGIGITHNQQNVIFNSFSQATGSAQGFGGTGLGLAISRNLVEMMGGKLWVKSEFGKGSTFGFSIDLKEIPTQGNERLTLQINQGEGGKVFEGKKVLLVEDNEINSHVITQFLEKNSLEVDHAKNGVVAVRMSRENSYDLILMDLLMPVMGGKEASQKIRVFDQQTPIVALTASAPFENVSDLKDLGMNDLIPKPFKPKEFWKVIKEQLLLHSGKKNFR